MAAVVKMKPGIGSPALVVGSKKPGFKPFWGYPIFDPQPYEPRAQKPIRDDPVRANPLAIASDIRLNS